jgi:hypothetical protein
MNSNSISIWIKELSARPFIERVIERVSEPKNHEYVISRELWIYIRKTHPHYYIIPAGSYLIPPPSKK